MSLPQVLRAEALMLTTQTTFPRPQVSLWAWLSAVRDRLNDIAAMDRLHRVSQDRLATLSGRELRDLGLDENPYRLGGLRGAAAPGDQLAARSLSLF